MPKPWTERFGFLRQPASSKANSQPGQQTGSKAKSKTTNQQAGSKTSPLTRQIGSNRLLRRFLIILAIVAIPLLLLLYWWYHPPINIHSEGTWGFIILFILVPAWIIFRFRALLAQRDASTQSNRPQELDESGRLKATAIDKDKAKKAGQIAVLFKRLSWIPVGGLVVFLIGSLLSSPIFPGNAVRYADILVVETRDFSTDIKEVNYAEIPVIDRESATLLGNRVMGEIPEYVSQFVINPLYSQINFRGKPVRISPLDYADLFKWFTNRNTGLPGYVLIDMATQDSKIMRLDAPMLYSQSEPLGRNIDRHVQLSFPFYMFDQKSIEIDEDGHPWWVCPVQTRRIGLFGGTDITRVVLCDAATGECIDLSIDECPKWVDRVYPADLVLAQYNWHGAYQKGWINSWLGQEGVVQTTPGTNGQLGYNYIAKDDDVWVYTGITSAVSDSSIVGFVLINQRTAEARFYPMSGATEESAMYSAQGQVQHLRYQSTFPLLVNVHGQPTYFMAL
ncbi:MAG: Tat pathway signal sequence, partial [Coriobacteriales bacterium]|nr:Tat pathway signal sequence [Coriobacteriales bacterium]